MDFVTLGVPSTGIWLCLFCPQLHPPKFSSLPFHSYWLSSCPRPLSGRPAGSHDPPVRGVDRAWTVDRTCTTVHVVSSTNLWECLPGASDGSREHTNHGAGNWGCHNNSLDMIVEETQSCPCRGQEWVGREHLPSTLSRQGWMRQPPAPAMWGQYSLLTSFYSWERWGWATFWTLPVIVSTGIWI